MAKAKSQFICQSLRRGHVALAGPLRGLRRVEHASSRSWSIAASAPGPKSAIAGGRPVELVPLSGETESAARIVTGIAELDRVTGGGFVMGSARAGRRRSGHRQIDAAAAGGGGAGQCAASASSMSRAKRRWRRSGCARSGSASASAECSSPAKPMSRSSSRRCRTAQPPHLVIIDSIQTLWTDRVDSAPGTVTQVRTSAQALTRFAKKSGAAVVLVGHVTKDGQIAGPRVVEHMVDAVLYFEGDASHTFRILRGVKNRFGATDEIGVFEMTTLGLQRGRQPLRAVPRPARRGRGRLGGVRRHGGHAPGAVRNPGAGRALAARHAAPRRRRLGFVAAVDGAGGARDALRRAHRRQRHLSQRRGRAEGQRAGGRSRGRGGADFVAHRFAAAARCVYFGEISLAGGVRPVVHASLRLREAQKLGFKSAVTGKLGAGDNGQRARASANIPSSPS